MKILNCPLNGPRNITEFACFGEVRRPPIEDCSDAEWAAQVWLRTNAAGVVREWWCHVPTSYWFVAERDTRTDTVIRTLTVREALGDRE